MKRKFRKLALASAVAFTLAGFGSTGMAAGAPHEHMHARAQNESVPDQLRDARREAQIWTTYALNPHLHAFDLKVEVKGDEATLSGKVQSGTAKDLAEQIALGVEGIGRVDNRLVVDSGYQPPRRESGARDFGDVVQDATTTASIKSKLLWNSHTDGLDIHVDTKHGVVTLTGAVGSGTEKDLAGRIAENTDDVVRVSNQLAVDGKPGTAARARDKASTAANETKEALSDGWITTKVKSSLMLTRDVQGLGISVTTDNGIVSLAGEVDSKAEKQRVVAIARDVRGVRKVDPSGIRIE
jgi:hyperosmotically inducible periplasmic protein